MVILNPHVQHHLGIKVWNLGFKDKVHHKNAIGFRNEEPFGYTSDNSGFPL
jgi:hypothetical protein